MSQPQPQISSPRLVIHDLTKQNGHANFAHDVRAGLSSTPKHLFPKYLYDELGSRLFEAICAVPEYYLTRAEHEILSTHADDIVGAMIRHRGESLFIPIDISASALKQSSETLLGCYPELRIRAYAADYFQALEALPSLGRPPVLVLFLGSNIGNFEPAEALNFLRAIRRVLRQGDALLLGADLKKDRGALEAAYNDPLGVTRAFIMNELERINRELDANFDLWAFGLRSFYNEQRGRVEVYLESLRDQAVEIRDLDLSLRFAAGERIHVENAYKFDLEGLKQLASETGFTLERTWLDKEKRFSSNLLFAV
jgi:L-histidine Nalpha-methyltransferase